MKKPAWSQSSLQAYSGLVLVNLAHQQGKTALSILVDITLVTSVDVYDDGKYYDPSGRQAPFLATLLFIS